MRLQAQDRHGDDRGHDDRSQRRNDEGQRSQRRRRQRNGVSADAEQGALREVEPPSWPNTR